DARDHAVGAQALLLPVGQQRLLGEAALVEQQRDALAHAELALLARLVVMALGTTRERAGGGPAEVAHGRGSPRYLWRRRPRARWRSWRACRRACTTSRSEAGP